MAVVVGTWSFSLEAVKLISDKLRGGSKGIDALENGINVIEENPDTGSYFVGRGGFPNSNGVLECDAAVMVGEKCHFGAVAALQGVAMPFSVARCVMEKSPHSILVGKGAQEFAIKNGFPVESNSALQTPKSREAFEDLVVQKVDSIIHWISHYPADNTKDFVNTYPLDSDSSDGLCCPPFEQPGPEEFLRKPGKEVGSHDTIGILVLDSKMQIAAGVSSSGVAFKHPGRIGDSPLPGSGLYADDEIGAATATGDGDKMMRFCPAFHVVQLMKEGYSPQEACEIVVKEAQRKAGTTAKPFEMALIALNKKGDVGASGTVPFFEDERLNTKYSGFPFVVWTEQMDTPEIRVQSPVCLQ